MAEKTEETRTLVTLARKRAFFTLCLFMVIVGLKLFMLRAVALGGGMLGGLGLDLVFVFLVFAIFDLFFADMRFRAMVFADLVLSVLMVAIALYVSYYHVVPTRESLSAIGQAGTVGDSIAQLLDWRLALFLIDVPVLFSYALWMRRRGFDPSTRLRSGIPLPGSRTPYVYQVRFVYLAAAMLAVVFAVGVNQIRSVPNTIDGKTLSRRHGLSTFLVASVMGQASMANASGLPPVKEMQAYINKLRGEQKAEKPLVGFIPGAAHGKNVIIVQMEALQSAAIGATVEGKPVTPNLDRLIKRSWYCKKGISGVGLGTTSDAEFLTATSYYPASGGPSTLQYADRELPSLPRLLAAQGYQSVTFHTNSAQYWNRSQLYPAIGFTRYYDRKFFGNEEKIAYGASDRILYKKTLAELERIKATGDPFYAQLIGLSSHFPFIGVPAKDRTLGVSTSSYKGTIEGDYLTEINYCDRQIGVFIDALDDSGLLDDSILVVYGDHFGLPEPKKAAEEQALRTLLGHEYDSLDRVTVPIIIHLPGQTEGRVFPRPVGQVDLMPTLADALGVSLTGMPHFGRSAFIDAPVLISAGGLLPAGSYVDDKVLYVNGDTFESGTTYRLDTGDIAPITDADKSKVERVEKLVALSDGHVRRLPKRADYDASAKHVIPMEQ